MIKKGEVFEVKDVKSAVEGLKEEIERYAFYDEVSGNLLVMYSRVIDLIDKYFEDVVVK